MDPTPKTPPQQDWWYPDTVPNGNLIAAWIALEDIDERAGRFYVMRDSQSVNLHEDLESLTHRAWLARMAAWEDEHQDQLVAPALKKVDVLFWNSSTMPPASGSSGPTTVRPMFSFFANLIRPLKSLAGTALATAGHTCAQAPQLFGSDCNVVAATHALPQRT